MEAEILDVLNKIYEILQFLLLFKLVGIANKCVSWLIGRSLF